VSDLPVYTEILDQNRSSDFKQTADNDLILVKDKLLYPTLASDFIIPQGTSGQLLSPGLCPFVT
jgi:hypothetical protein